ncbi:MAG: hypothetical protein JWP69_2329 [Flaviaesturariibacter sp.]|nr:hypothetical protein [Flaviaesturariibacter sp.]
MQKIEIPYHKIELDNDVIFIKKSKFLLRKKIVTILILLTIAGFTIWSLPSKSPDDSIKSRGAIDLILLTIVSAFIIASLYFGIKRLQRVLSNFTLLNSNGLFINNKRFTNDENSDNVRVVIQDVGASRGVGGSFTVGLSSGSNQFAGLCYELKKEHALEIADFIATNFSLVVEHREATFFPLFKLH